MRAMDTTGKRMDSTDGAVGLRMAAATAILAFAPPAFGCSSRKSRARAATVADGIFDSSATARIRKTPNTGNAVNSRVATPAPVACATAIPMPVITSTISIDQASRVRNRALPRL